MHSTDSPSCVQLPPQEDRTTVEAGWMRHDDINCGIANIASKHFEYDGHSGFGDSSRRQGGTNCHPCCAVYGPRYVYLLVLASRRMLILLTEAAGISRASSVGRSRTQNRSEATSPRGSGRACSVPRPRQQQVVQARGTGTRYDVPTYE